MGFLSAYDGTRRIDLGGGYWVDVKKCLSIVEKQRAERALTSDPTVDMNGRGTAKVDMPGFHNEMISASIVAWNLDEDDGTAWALTPEPVKRKNIARLPSTVFDAVWKVVDELNGPRPTGEQAQFPVPGVGGDPDGHPGAAQPVDVLDGSPVVAAPWPAAGGSGVPAVA